MGALSPGSGAGSDEPFRVCVRIEGCLVGKMCAGAIHSRDGGRIGARGQTDRTNIGRKSGCIRRVGRRAGCASRSCSECARLTVPVRGAPAGVETISEDTPAV